MPRVRWCSCPLLVLVISTIWIVLTNADCWYEEESYTEGSEVVTTESCLNCTCSRGALLCYLRVCPRLPNPPPAGCILLHRYHTCCPELICTEMGSTNTLEGRSDPIIDFDLPAGVYDDSVKNACIVNGSIYSPGSALVSSNLCKYCYCLGGRETCVKPKCLLPIDGCVPIYEPGDCCPVHYNCTRDQIITSSTTTTKPKRIIEQGGCVVDNVHYKEGGKVLGVGHSACDNCYCLRGILRCEPLSCAPPLLGCSPVVRPGECCAASYNCSGTIEIQPEPNYGQFPVVSKEYAKLHKHIVQKSSKRQPQFKPTDKSNIPFYVLAESPSTTKSLRSPATFGTTRHFTGAVSEVPSTVKPGNIIDLKNFKTTIKQSESNTIKTILTTVDYKNEEKLRSSDYLHLSDDTLLSIVDSLLDSRLNRRVENGKNKIEEVSTITESNKIEVTEEITTTNEPTTLLEISTTDLSTTTDATTILTNHPLEPLTLKTVLNSTDCIHNSAVELITTTVLPADANEINRLATVDGKTVDDYISTTANSEENADLTTPEMDVTEVDLESQVKVSSATIRSVPLDQTVLNITSKTKNQDYEYDYNEPSLPPSLPNLRIIPFVAADAVDPKNEKPAPAFERDNSFTYTNLFSPPVETEGGFMPKDPLILNNFFENGATVPSITNKPKTDQVSCLSEGQEVAHGKPLPSDSPCITCSCFYGTVVCQNKPCPLPRPGCLKAMVQSIDSCCAHYICDDQEAPTVVLDRLETTNIKVPEVAIIADSVNTPDPFRDVIRTEPAPNLQSLFVDMMPFLTTKQTTTSTTNSPLSTAVFVTTQKIQYESDNHKSKDDYPLDKVLQLWLANSNDKLAINEQKQQNASSVHQIPSSINLTTTLSNETGIIHEDSNDNESYSANSVDTGSTTGHAILKLAGCNIYGRMYRVGRIISELSNACLECKCTEIGVQCRALKC